VGSCLCSIPHQKDCDVPEFEARVQRLQIELELMTQERDIIRKMYDAQKQWMLNFAKEISNENCRR
jgi:hypothetical protein